MSGFVKPHEKDELVFLPLGGSNEIGMNFNLYGYGPPKARQWIVMDFGITFGDPSLPGIDIILPDPQFLEKHQDGLLAIVLTHAHEDHIGALPWLFDRIKAPIYATPFTAYLVREKLREKGHLKQAEINIIPLGGKFDIGPFSLEFVTLTHSIPEPNGVAIKTPLGTVFHTGDWKIDSNPMIGQSLDHQSLSRLGEEGVLAMVCDSTNVFVEGEAGSEAQARQALSRLIKPLKGKVAVGCFASNVARMESVILAAQDAGRRVCLLGRSMQRMAAAARSVGLLADVLPFVADREAATIDKNAILYLCTGSQGEPRAALSRIAEGNHPVASLGRGDNCIFSSRVIPGNEIAIRNLQNRLADRGVRLYTDRDHPDIHVSGHPCRDELAQMYRWVRPRIAIPTHGERRHILEHQAFTRELQIPEQMAPRNGDMIRLAPGSAEVIETVTVGRLFLDGGILTKEEAEPLRERRQAAVNGIVILSLMLNKKGRLTDGIEIRSLGIPGDNNSLETALDDIADEVADQITVLEDYTLNDDVALETVIIRTVKKYAQKFWSRRPIIEVIINRV